MTKQSSSHASEVGGFQPPTILLIRHAVTPYNQEGRIRAWSDIGIDEDKGRDDTLATAKALEGFAISSLYSSDLFRARRTAEILANQWFLDVLVNRDLRPWDLGDFTGASFEDVKTELKSYIEDGAKRVPGGESFNQFMAHWKSGIALLTAAVLAAPSKVIAAVVHSRNIEAMKFLLNGSKDLEQLANGKSVPPSGVMVLEVKEGRIREKPFANSHISKEDE